MSETCTRCGRRAVITTRDGKPYCKHHGDRLPRHLRRAAGVRSGAVSRAQARPAHDRGDPYRAR
jgi:hypothetical protein